MTLNEDESEKPNTTMNEQNKGTPAMAPTDDPPLLLPHQVMNSDSNIVNSLATTMTMIARLLERQSTPIHVTTAPDLTSTLPTYSGMDNDNLKEWYTALESMRSRSSWSDAATLSAAISRLRGRALEWHKTDGSHTKNGRSG